MAVNKVPQVSKLVITVEDGLTAKGLPKQRQRSYKNVKVSALDADVYAAAQAMANLQTRTVVSISRQDEGHLVEA